MGMISEFKDFLYEYKVIPLAIALIMGIASTAFIKSFVDNIVMPIITPFIPGGAWKTATLANWAHSTWLGCLSGRIDKLYYHRTCGFHHCKKDVE